MIVSGDKDGMLCVWRLSNKFTVKDEIRNCKFQKATIFCVECALHDKNIVALG